MTEEEKRQAFEDELIDAMMTPLVQEPEELEPEVEVETEVIVRKPKEPEARFGWCMTAQHELCPQTNGAAVCHCPCDDHGSSYERGEGDGMSNSLREISKRYL